MGRSPTIRDVFTELRRALQGESRKGGESLNRTVLLLLRRALGLEGGRPPDNGLSRLAGTWSEEEFRRFEKAVAVCERVDEDLWR